MSKNKIFIAVCCFLLGAGIVITIVGFSLGGIVTGIGLTSHGMQVYSPALIDEPKYESADISLDSFENIDISVVDADIEILESDHYGITYQVMTSNNFSYEVKDNKLNITQSYMNSGSNFSYMFFGFNNVFSNKEFKKVFITVSVPENTSLDIVSVYNDYGGIKLSNLSSASISLDTDSGYIDLSNIEASNYTTVNNDYGNIDMIYVNSPSISLKADSGNIDMENIQTEQLDVDNNYGNLNMEQVVMSDADIALDSGNIEMREVSSASTLTVYNQYGSLDMEQVVMSGADITLDSGNVKMNEVSGSTLVINNGYGDVIGDTVTIEDAVMELESGNLKMKNFTLNQIDIVSDYGSVTMDITAPATDYNYDLFTDYGSIKINNQNMGDTYHSLQSSDSDNSLIKVNCESGNISINTQ